MKMNCRKPCYFSLTSQLTIWDSVARMDLNRLVDCATIKCSRETASVASFWFFPDFDSCSTSYTTACSSSRSLNNWVRTPFWAVKNLDSFRQGIFWVWKWYLFKNMFDLVWNTAEIVHHFRWRFHFTARPFLKKSS